MFGEEADGNPLEGKIDGYQGNPVSRDLPLDLPDRVGEGVRFKQ